MSGQVLNLDATLEGVRGIGPWLSTRIGTGTLSRWQPRLGEIELALHELAVNVVEHSYGDNDEGSIALTLGESDDLLVAEMVDHGRAFAGAPEPPSPDQPQIGGYGLMIIEQIAASVRHERVESTNRWTLTFDPPLV